MIFPLRDSTPCLHRPYMTWLLIVVTILCYLGQLAGDAQYFKWVASEFGLIPVRFWAQIGVWEVTRLFSYAFLHGSWWHLLSNMWVLWIFADNVEDVTGPWRFLAFYLICAMAAGIVHSLVNASVQLPVVGASGAVSGVLGAYFLLYPRARVLTFIVMIFVEVPAYVYLGGWFIFQLVAGLGGGPDSTIAWWAHLGGFVAGVLFLPLFKNNRAVPSVLPQPKKTVRHNPNDPWERLRSK